jgi:hypothetical protein
MNDQAARLDGLFKDALTAIDTREIAEYLREKEHG